jgi:hypothetical protein
MLNIARRHGGAGVSDADRHTLDAAARIVLGLPDGVPADLTPYPPVDLARAMSGDEEDATQAVRMIAVMCLVDGEIDDEKISPVQEYASALNVHEAYLKVLAEAAAGEIAAASVCMMRKNAETFPGLDLESFDTDRIAPFLGSLQAQPVRLSGRSQRLGRGVHDATRQLARAKRLLNLPGRRTARIDVYRGDASRPPDGRRGASRAVLLPPGHRDERHRFGSQSRVPTSELLDCLGPRGGDHRRRV